MSGAISDFDIRASEVMLGAMEIPVQISIRDLFDNHANCDVFNQKLVVSVSGPSSESDNRWFSKRTVCETNLKGECNGAIRLLDSPAIPQTLHFEATLLSADGIVIRTKNASANVVPCKIGFGLTKSSATNGTSCHRCAFNSYNLVEAFLPQSDVANQCHVCPEHAQCTSDGVLLASPGHYAIFDHDGKAQMFECLPGVCVGGDVDKRGGVGVKFEELSNGCVANRTGLLCASCNCEDCVAVAPRSSDGSDACLLCDSDVNWLALSALGVVRFLVRFIVFCFLFAKAPTPRRW